MWVALFRHVALVTGLAGSLAAIVPGFLFWPRLTDPVYASSLVRYYLLEMGFVGVIVLAVGLSRTSWGTSLVWAACGLTAAFAGATGFTIGSLYLPAAMLFALSGVLGDLSRPRALLRDLLIGAAAATVQLSFMALVVLRLTRGNNPTL
jgi:hypothetical protein